MIVGICRYCGQPAGFLRRQHKECRLLHDEAAIKIVDFFVKALGSTRDQRRHSDDQKPLRGSGVVGVHDGGPSHSRRPESLCSDLLPACVSRGRWAAERRTLQALLLDAPNKKLDETKRSSAQER